MSERDLGPGERERSSAVELERRERAYRTLVENSPDAIVRLDRRLVVLSANRATQTALGREPGILIGQPIAAAIPDERARAAWLEAAGRTRDRAQECEIEFELPADSGRRHYILRTLPELGLLDAVESILCIAYDVTERREALERLSESETRFTQLANNTGDVFWVGDPEHGRMLYVNGAFERLWGIAWEELRRDPAQWSAAIEASARHVAPPPALLEGDTEYRIRARDGTLRWIRDRRFAVRDATGRLIRTTGIAEDITDRKRREQDAAQLLARERSARAAAESVARAKDEFLAVVSHELRSPLNAIRGWAHLLSREGTDRAVIARAAEAIQRNADAQARVIDDLLDTARVIQGTLNVELRPCSIYDVIDNAIEAQRPALLAKPLTLERDLEPNIGLVVMDPQRIEQVLVNLLSNAIKFTPAHGKIRVAAKLAGASVEVSVADDGIGIAPEFLPHVFERFRQADTSRTRRHGGVGLGLALARQLVLLHGGSIHAASAGTGQGTTFTVSLPLQEYSSIASAVRTDELGRSSAPGCALAGLNVVVVDDSDDGREIVALLLESSGAQVRAFDRAAPALAAIPQLLAQWGSLVLLSDLAMPDMDGYALLEAVRARLGDGSDAQRFFAYALTAHAGEAEKARAQRAGFDGFFVKPIEPHVLVSGLRRALGAARAH